MRVRVFGGYSSQRGWSSLSLPVVTPNIAVTSTVVSVVSRTWLVDGELTSITPFVTVGLGTASALSTVVEFEYVVCAGSCSRAQLSLWTKLGPGMTALGVKLGDGPYEFLARVAGASVLGSSHPSTRSRFSVRAARPVTLIQGFQHDSSFRDVSVTLALLNPGQRLDNASSIWYSLDGTAWQHRNGTSFLQLQVTVVVGVLSVSRMNFLL